MSLSKIFAATVLSLAVASPAMAGQLVINGSTTVLPVMQKAGEAFMASHPDIQLSISGGGSGSIAGAPGPLEVVAAAVSVYVQKLAAGV